MSGHGTSTEQLERWCRKQQVPHFAGVFCSSQKPQLGVQARVIFNYSPCGQEGTHWVAFIKEGDRGWFFDSMGMPPDSSLEQAVFNENPGFKDWISEQVTSYKYNTIDMEPIAGTSCGQYCLWTVLHGTPQMNPRAWLWLTSNKAANDHLVKMLTQV